MKSATSSSEEMLARVLAVRACLDGAVEAVRMGILSRIPSAGVVHAEIRFLQTYPNPAPEAQERRDLLPRLLTKQPEAQERRNLLPRLLIDSPRHRKGETFFPGNLFRPG